MIGTNEPIGAVVSTRSIGGLSVFDPQMPIDATRAGAFASTLDDARHVADTLIRLGFEITNFHATAISFSATSKQFNDVLGVRLHRDTIPAGRGRLIDVVTPDADDAARLLDLPSAFANKAEGIAIACQPKLIDDAGPPVRGLNGAGQPDRCLPDGLAMSIWGDGLATLDATGDGIVAALIGTGHYRHRFFTERRYRVLPTLLGPGQDASLRDDHGHSTGEAACLFAATPNLRLRPVKGLLDPVGDILMTIDSLPRPDLIVTSFGYDVDQVSWAKLAADDLNLHNYLRLLEAAIAQATAEGIVVAAAAPRTWQSFPASHPDVIAIGATGTIGVAVANGRSSASNGQDGAVSHLYPGRLVPDFWSQAGDSVDIGQERCGIGFAQPSQPGSTLSRMGPAETSIVSDGWAWCDLNQASYPLAASMLAVLLERYPGLPPAAVKAFMAKATEELGPVSLARMDQSLPSEPAIGVGIDGRAGVLAVDDHMAALAGSLEPALAKVGAGT